MSPFQLVSVLRTKLMADIEVCLSHARAVEVDSSKTWDAYLISLALIPPSAEDRAIRYQLNKTITHGALPIEVRTAIEHHVRQMLLALNDYKRIYEHESWWESRVAKPMQQLATDVLKQSLKEYIGSISTNNASAQVLENAAGVSYGFKEYFSKSGAKSHLCPTCRAARPADSELTTCYFCGSTLF